MEELYEKALHRASLSLGEGLQLYSAAPLSDLMYVASRLRQLHVPGNHAGWMIDRNINLTNICHSQCLFCNFCRTPGAADAYVLTLDEYSRKIDELFRHGGNQVLLQGGMNPHLGIDFYTELFRSLKRRYPSLKLHALGPPEIVFLAARANLSYRETLSMLIDAGLDSLPGAGAEILADRVRKTISPAKATAGQWLEVMREAHRLNLPTSATMMFGHVETAEERIAHLVSIRNLQAEKPADSCGFIAFIPWAFQGKGSKLSARYGISHSHSGYEYLRIVAISRIMLNNIPNIQASLLTVGRETGMLSLHAGANDLGSIMMEENVVSSAGGGMRFDAEEMQQIITMAGFTPLRRNQKYEPA
ncbi:MAG: dehypoxanthine futalosine cyclase [Bacteroidales bacterium]|jgi:cyclic dehypoxanthinyl futalosine synthase|nr:dehypoxanthine futalosine cyclase [Bacteroidales bacterium]